MWEVSDDYIISRDKGCTITADDRMASLVMNQNSQEGEKVTFLMEAQGRGGNEGGRSMNGA